MCGHFTWSIIRLWTFYVKLHVWLLQDWLLNFDKNIGALCSFCLKIFWTKSKVYTILSTIFGDHISERRANENLTPNKVLKNEIVYTCRIWCKDDLSLWSSILSRDLLSTWHSLYQKNVYESWRKMKEDIYFDLIVISFVYFVFSAKLSLRYFLFKKRVKFNIYFATLSLSSKVGSLYFLSYPTGFLFARECA